MEGFSFVMTVTGLNIPNTGKDNDDDDTFFFYHNYNTIPHSLMKIKLRKPHPIVE
jgi:hypothetical protein